MIRYTFRNCSAVPLLAPKIKTSCGCESATFSLEEVPPGADGVLEVTLRLEERQVHRGSARLMWSDGAKTQLTWQCYSKEAADIRAAPAEINWGTVRALGDFTVRVCVGPNVISESPPAAFATMSDGSRAPIGIQATAESARDGVRVYDCQLQVGEIHSGEIPQLIVISLGDHSVEIEVI